MKPPSGDAPRARRGARRCPAYVSRSDSGSRSRYSTPKRERAGREAVRVAPRPAAAAGCRRPSRSRALRSCASVTRLRHEPREHRRAVPPSRGRPRPRRRGPSSATCAERVAMADGREVGRRTSPSCGPGRAGSRRTACRPVARRVRAGAQVHVGELQRHGDRLVDPRPPEVREHEAGVGGSRARRGRSPIGRPHSLGMSPPDVPACIATGTSASAHTRVERVVVGVVEAAVPAVRVEVAADDPRVARAAARSSRTPAIPRVGIDERERREPPGPPADELLDLLPPRRRGARSRTGRARRARPMSPVGSSSVAMPSSSMRSTIAGGLGERVAVVAPHLHLRRPPTRSRRPTRAARSGVNALHR